MQSYNATMCDVIMFFVLVAHNSFVADYFLIDRYIDVCFPLYLEEI